MNDVEIPEDEDLEMTEDEDLEIVENTDLYINYSNGFSQALTEVLNDDLVSVVVFGDVMEGKKVKSIDIFVVSNKPCEPEMVKKIEKGLKKTEEYKDLKKKKLGTHFKVANFTPSEVEKNPPILSNVTKEGFPLYDTDDFIFSRMEGWETVEEDIEEDGGI